MTAMPRPQLPGDDRLIPTGADGQPGQPTPVARPASPLLDPEPLTGWLLASSDGGGGGVTPEGAARLLADHAPLREAVAARLLIHGLLRSHYEFVEHGTALRDRRVETAMAALTAASTTVAQPTVKRDTVNTSPPSRPARWRPSRRWATWAAAAGLALATGWGAAWWTAPPVGDPFDTNPTLTGLEPTALSAAEILDAVDSQVRRETDRQYAIVTLDETDKPLRHQWLYLRGQRQWALDLGSPPPGLVGPRAWLGSDGTTDWVRLDEGHPAAQWLTNPQALRWAKAGALRGLLTAAAHEAPADHPAGAAALPSNPVMPMAPTGLTGLVEHLRRGDFAVEVVGRTQPPALPGFDTPPAPGEAPSGSGSHSGSGPRFGSGLRSDSGPRLGVPSLASRGPEPGRSAVPNPVVAPTIGPCWHLRARRIPPAAGRIVLRSLELWATDDGRLARIDLRLTPGATPNPPLTSPESQPNPSVWPAWRTRHIVWLWIGETPQPDALYSEAGHSR